MNIRQIGVDFQSDQDRLMLKFSTDPGGIVRLLVTRRFLKLFWAHLVALLEKHVIGEAALSEEAKRAMREMRQEQVLSAADFRTPFKDAPSTDGALKAPLLLKAFKLQYKGANEWFVSFIPGDGPSIDLNAPDALLIAVCKLLRDAAGHAGWDLNLKLFEPTAAPEPERRRIN